MFEVDEVSLSMDDFLNSELEMPPTWEEIRTAEMNHKIPGFNSSPLHQVSNSSFGLKSSCPRKYQLTKLTQPEKEKAAYLSYGSALGVGIQYALAGLPEEYCTLQMMMAWDVDLNDTSRESQKQTFWHCLHAFQVFYHSVRPSLFGNDWEVITINDRPAIELSFRIILPANYYYRGFIDLVLKNKFTGEVMIVELKTTSMNYTREEAWKNSGQGLGYAVVLDHIEPLSSFRVLYLVCLTKSQTFEPFQFVKFPHQRVRWMQDAVIKCKELALWETEGHYPMEGGACLAYSRPCQFFGICEQEDEALLANDANLRFSHKHILEETYDFDIFFSDLVQSQMAKL